MNSHAKFRGAARRGFSVIYEKPPGGGYPPPPVGARVKTLCIRCTECWDSPSGHHHHSPSPKLVEINEQNCNWKRLVPTGENTSEILTKMGSKTTFVEFNPRTDGGGISTPGGSS